MSDEEPSGLPVPNPSSSFWHSEPNEFLIGHRTTPELPAHADVVIVGSGITGASVARYLNEDVRMKGKTTVMLEAREACWGATGRNGGHCQPLLYDHGPDVAAFELKNVAAVGEYITKHKIACEWRPITGCRTLWSDDLLTIAEGQVEMLRKTHPDIAKRIKVIKDPAELQANRIGEGCKGATLTQGAASLWPYKYVAFILESLVKAGALNIQTNTPVTRIEAVSSSESSKSSPFRRILHTPRGTIKAHTVILATNGYTSHILPSFADLIVPNRGEMSALLPPRGMQRLANSYGFVGSNGQDPQHDDYLVQRPFDNEPNPAGHLMFGGGRDAGNLPSVHEWDDSVIDEAAAAYLRRVLLDGLILGGDTADLTELEATHQWTGIMGYSRDDAPWVGQVPDCAGLFMAAGYTGHGMPNATLCGKAVVEMALADMNGEDAEALRERMVRDADLPVGYFITKDRMANARQLPTVEVADQMGFLGLKLPKV
ncbi:FAD dependent oxidoreductase-like protein [Pseudovirgaria hyperparasitica]|uniref:FAD dependent oxidoreductase-like protein n=1 Tax=Pseudovirgaria hyperparasitica TaxID=470096 RepID=A0A6A6W553_9PEZI|nr:FAD dependent oxidoreductase-like protein [Pseudovirgaria hyperparasitica]KAF2757723.1 FAD dependent oxidoreductase-like protein [Pseudovirgaria hyperparasitica]